MTARKIEYIDIAELVPATRNSKLHDDDGIEASFTEFGFVEPIVLDERTGRLVVGHGRWEKLTAMLAAGQPAPEGIRAVGGKWKVPVLRGWSSTSDGHAEAYLIASNQLTAKGGWDQAALIETLSDLQAFDLLDVTGFDAAALTDMVAAHGPDSQDEPAPSGGALEALDDVTIDYDPMFHVERGEVWELDGHVLACVDVMADHEVWTPLLVGLDLFVPYPGVYAPHTERAEERSMLLVQPDPFLASHIVDKYATVKGAEAVRRR